jgi:hypothetical protein
VRSQFFSTWDKWQPEIGNCWRSFFSVFCPKNNNSNLGWGTVVVSLSLASIVILFKRVNLIVAKIKNFIGWVPIFSHSNSSHVYVWLGIGSLTRIWQDNAFSQIHCKLLEIF